MATKGALRAARIIMGGDETILTEYGRKTVDGLAELIDDQTGAYDMLEACKAVMEWARTPGNHGGNPYRHKFVSMAEKAGLKNEGSGHGSG